MGERGGDGGVRGRVLVIRRFSNARDGSGVSARASLISCQRPPLILEIELVEQTRLSTSPPAHHRCRSQRIGMTPKDIAEEASTVWKREPVRARIMELKEEVAARNHVTHDAVVGMLLETYQSARAAGQHGVANSTAFNLAKVCGHVVDKREIAEQRSDTPPPNTPDLAERLAQVRKSGVSDALMSREREAQEPGDGNSQLHSGTA